MNKLITALKPILLILLLFSFSSCIDVSYSTRRKNYICEGLYSGENSTYSVNIFLRIKRIYKEEFIAANGVNVIEDYVRPAYYSIYLYYYEEEVKMPYYTFSNFTDVYDGSYSTSIAYKDDYGCFFIPRFSSNNNDIKTFYCSVSLIDHINSQYYFSATLYPIDS